MGTVPGMASLACSCGHHRIEHPDGGACQHSVNPATAGSDAAVRCTCPAYRATILGGAGLRFAIAA